MMETEMEVLLCKTEVHKKTVMTNWNFWGFRFLKTYKTRRFVPIFQPFHINMSVLHS